MEAEAAMSHNFMPQLTTVTATATVAYNTVDLQVDVTRPYQQSSPLTDHSLSSYQTSIHHNLESSTSTLADHPLSSYQTLTYHNLGSSDPTLTDNPPSSYQTSTCHSLGSSAPTLTDHPLSSYQTSTHHNLGSSDFTSQSTFYSPPQPMHVSELGVPPSCTMSSSTMTAMCSRLPDSHYNTGYGTWYENTDTEESQYSTSDFLITNADTCVGYEQYDNFTNGFDDVVEHPGNHFLQSEYSRHAGPCDTSNLDHSSYPNAYSDWHQLEDYVHDDRPGDCRYRERPNEYEKHSGEMRHQDHDNALYTAGQTPQGCSGSSYTDSQGFFTLPYSQSPDLLSCRNQREKAPQNILNAVNPFHESTDAPKWLETDTDDLGNRQTRPSSRTHIATKNDHITGFHDIVTQTHKDTLKDNKRMSPPNQKQSDEKTDGQKHELPKSTKQNGHIQHRSSQASYDTHQPTLDNVYRGRGDSLSGIISQSVHQQSVTISPTGSPNFQTKPSMSESSCTEGLRSSNSNSKNTRSSQSVSPTTASHQVSVNSPHCTSAHTSVHTSVKETDDSCRNDSPVSQTEESLSSPSSSIPHPLIDVDHLLSSGVTVAGFKPRPIIRKRRKVMIPAPQKDVSYWHKRKKNNDSAKRSREAKKEKEKNFYRRALELEYENYFLKERLGQMEAQLQAVTGMASGLPPLPPPPPDYAGMVPMASVDYSSGPHCMS